MKQFSTVALLVSAASAMQVTEWASDSAFTPNYYTDFEDVIGNLAQPNSCHTCIKYGLTWCVKNTDHEFTDLNGETVDYTVGAFGFINEDIGADYMTNIDAFQSGAELVGVCCDDTTCPDVGFWGEDSGGDGITPPKSEYTCFGKREGTNSHVAMAACPTVQSMCFTGYDSNQYTFKLGDAEQELVTKDDTYLSYSADQDFSGCTYKITAQSGAPGFSSVMATCSSYAYDRATFQHEYFWVEYDLEEVAAHGDSTWPSLEQEFHGPYNCPHDNCKQGDLYARVKEIDNGTDVKVTAQDILHQLREKRHDNNLYIIQQNGVNTFNDENPTAEPMKNLPLPDPYTGDTFENTESAGGFGMPTVGNWWSHPFTQAMYKPYGTMGQGFSSEMSLVFDTSDRNRIMLLSVSQTENQVAGTMWEYADNEDWDNTCYRNGDYNRLTIGAYAFQPFDMDDFRVPSQADAKCPTLGDGAAQLAAGSLIVGLTMYLI